ncbi:hypothetical protein MKEN_00969300 [Mycena kentingensis (nom. inval.)]|nr:hypothetical protein MKEN_00969300 [Mycena kentingensis (nom. inval.)]
MCTVIELFEHCEICNLPKPAGYKKTVDCKDRKCRLSLIHPMSLYLNGCAIIPSGEYNLLVRMKRVQVRRMDGRVAFNVRVNVQQLKMRPEQGASVGAEHGPQTACST